MAINVSVQHNGGLLPDIIPVDPRSLPSSGNSFKYHVEVLSLQPMKQYIITTTLFDDGHHIIYIARVRTNRVRLPTLLVVT